MSDNLHLNAGRRSRTASVAMAALMIGTALVGCRNDMHDQPRYDPLRKSAFFADSLSSRLPVANTVARGQYHADKLFYTGLPDGGARQQGASAPATTSAQQGTMQPNTSSGEVVGTGQTAPEGTARPQGGGGAQSTGSATMTTPQTTSGAMQGVPAHGSAQQAAVQGTGAGKFSPVFPFPVTRQVIVRGEERYNIYCSPCHGRTGDGQGYIVQRGFKVIPPSFHIERLRQAPPGYFFDVITNGFGSMYSYASRVPAADRWAIAAYVRALQLSQNAKAQDVPSGVNLDAPPSPRGSAHGANH